MGIPRRPGIRMSVTPASLEEAPVWVLQIFCFSPALLVHSLLAKDGIIDQPALLRGQRPSARLPAKRILDEARSGVREALRGSCTPTIQVVHLSVCCSERSRAVPSGDLLSTLTARPGRHIHLFWELTGDQPNQLSIFPCRSEHATSCVSHLILVGSSGGLADRNPLGEGLSHCPPF